MNIGVLHNAYRYRGGEESVAAAEAGLLESAGHRVSRLTFDNRVEFADLGPRLRSMSRSALGWNGNAAGRIDAWVRENELDLVHIHNLYPLITAAGPDALRRLRVPVVMTLHNFRALCANGTMTRDGAHCDECVSGSGASAIANRCYRGSVLQSAAWALGRQRARSANVWTEAISAFIAPSQHVAEWYARAGFPESRILVRPHFTPITGTGTGGPRDGVVCIGRVEACKGTLELVRRWPTNGPRLTVIGDGPDLELARQTASPNVTFTGQVDRDGVARHLRSAAALVSPSQLPETFGLTLIEAAACGVPGVAFATGGATSIIEDRVTGRLIEPGDFDTLINEAHTIAASERTRHGFAPRAFERYERLYSTAAGLRSLVAIYQWVLAPRAETAA